MDVDGGTQPPASEFVDAPRPGYVRLVQIRDFESDSHITYIPDSRKWRKCCTSDVLIARYGASLGRICTGLEGAYNVALAKVVPTDRIHLPFAYHLLRSHYFQGPLSASGGRSAQAGFNKDGLAVIPLPIPPLTEQRAIAQILGTLDDKIELNRRMSETLETMARALFKSWFVDFDPVRAKAEGRDPGLPKHIADLFPDSFEDSELGEIPRGWGAGTIDDLADVVGGSTPSTAEGAYWEGGTHCWVTPKDLSPLTVPVLLDTERRITDRGLAKLGSGLLPVGTVLLSSRAPIGYLAVTEVPVAVNQGFIAMKPRVGVPSLFLLLWARAMNEEILSRANGSTFLEISKSNFRPIPAVLPRQAVLSAFDRIATPLFRSIVTKERESRTLSTGRDTLLPKLISGELRVKNAEQLMGRIAP